MPDVQDNVPAGESVLINPAGQFVTLPQEKVPLAIKQQGYRVPSNQELSKEVNQQKYGTGIINPVKAALASGASGATFGLSDLLLTKTGLVNPETLKGLEEANPTVSGFGTGVGFVAPLLLTGGAAGIGELATAGLAKGATKQIIARSIAGALEGAAYGAGQSVHESALGDPNLNAQKVLHNIGIGALFGGATAGTISALGAAGQKASNALLGKFGRAATETAPELEGAIKPTGPIKMGGEIKFGRPDEEILKGAEKINPKNPLKQNDLDWIKENGIPDAEGKPTIFSKIGTDQVPTLNLAAKDQVTLADKLQEGIQKVNDTNMQMDAQAENLLRSDARTITREEYQQKFQDVIDKIKKSPDFGDPVGKKAVSKLENYIEAAQDLPDEMNPLEVKERLKSLRKESNIYTFREGAKEDFVSQKLNDAQRNIDDWLKQNEDYKNLMSEYKPVVDLSKGLEKHFKMNLDEVDSGLITNWTENRVVKPYQNQLYGSMKPAMQQDAKMLDKLGEFAGIDIGNTVKANLVYGKLNPELAQGLQKGTSFSSLINAVESLQHPGQIPGKLLGGTAKVLLTGEAPEFIQQMRAKELQGVLLGNMAASSRGIGSRLANMIEGAAERGSSLLKAAEPISGVGAALPFINQHNNLNDAERKLEIMFAMERANNATDKMIKSSVSKLFDESQEPQGNKKLDQFLNESTEKHSQEWEKIANELSSVINNPQIAIDRLSKNIEGLDEALPQTSAAMSATAMRAVAFLSQKLQLPTQLPLDSKYVPSKSQIAQAARYLKMINNPYAALDELKRGNFSHESKDVLTNVYPDLYEHLKSKVMEGIADQQSKGKLVPKSKRLGLSYFLDQPLDSGLNQMTLQKNYAMMAPMKMGTPPSSRKPSTLPSRLMTPMQRIAAR